MTYSESTSKIKVRSRWTIFKILQIFAFKWFRMETRLLNISKNTKDENFIKTIIESSYKFLLGPYSLVAPIHPDFAFNRRLVLSIVWHLNCYKFCFILRKIAK